MSFPALPRPSGLAALFLALLLGCGDDEATNPPAPTEIVVTLADFAPSSPAQGHYEVWVSFALLRHSEAASAGKFRIDAAGSAVDLAGQPMTFRVDPEDPNAQVQDGSILWQLAVDSFVTVEPAGDADSEPNLPGLLAGSFLNGSCALAVNAPDAIHVDLSSAAGSFVLATPTTGSTADEAEGVWFTAPGGATPALTLPALSAGTRWSYQAWVQHSTPGLASLGKFLLTNAADQDGPGPLGGTGYSFPGSDFPYGSSGVDLATATVFVTLEPPFDADGPGPFFFRVLQAPVGGAAAGTPVLLTAFPSGTPSGTVQIPLD